MSWIWWFLPIIPAIQETEIRRIAVQGQSEQQVSKTLISPKKPGMVVHTCDPSYTGG
jgi:hypothetical protein